MFLIADLPRTAYIAGVREIGLANAPEELRDRMNVAITPQ